MHLCSSTLGWAFVLLSNLAVLSRAFDGLAPRARQHRRSLGARAHSSPALDDLAAQGHYPALKQPRAFRVVDHTLFGPRFTSAPSSDIKFHTATRNADGSRTHYYNLVIEPRWLAPDGYWRKTNTFNGKTPGPTIEIDEGDWVHIHVFNSNPSQMTLHFHGIELRPFNDGVPGVTQWNILPYGNYSYSWQAHQYGAFWYHSHTRGTYADGARGSIVIHPKANRARPWALIGRSPADQSSMEEAYSKAGIFQIHDWRHESLDDAFVRYRFTGQDPYCIDSVLINSQGRMQCPSSSFLATQGKTGIDGYDGSQLDPTGCIPPRAGFVDSLSNVNPRECRATTSAYGMYTASKYASKDGKWAAFHLVNTASQHEICFSIDSHTMYLVAADGPFIHPQEVQVADLSIGMRHTVLVRLDQPKGQYTIRAALCRTREQIASGYAVFDMDLPQPPPPERKKSKNSEHESSAASNRKNPAPAVHTAAKSSSTKASAQQDSQASSGSMPASVITQFTGAAASQLNYPAVAVKPTMSVQPYMHSDDGAFKDLPQAPAKWSNGWTAQDGPVTNELPADRKDKMWLGYNGNLLNGAKSQTDPTLAPFPSDAPPQGRADYTFRVTINETNAVSWALNHSPFNSLNYQAEPLLLRGSASTQDPKGTILKVEVGKVVDVIFEDLGNGDFMDVAHPIHKHQNPVWVLAFERNKRFTWPDVATAGKARAQSGVNLINPPKRDSWMVPVNGYAVTRHYVVKPGATIMHCHLVAHHQSGMAVVFLEGHLNASTVPAWVRNYPHAQSPFVDEGKIGLDEL